MASTPVETSKDGLEKRITNSSSDHDEEKPTTVAEDNVTDNTAHISTADQSHVDSNTSVTEGEVPDREKDVEKGVAGEANTAVDLSNVTSRPNPALEGLDPKYIVDWDGADDPANPLNWPDKKKWGGMAIVSAITFFTPLASSMFAPGVPDVMRDFRSTNIELASFVVSIYILGFAFGPMLIAPLCELYGRLPLYMSCQILFVLFTVICGVSTNMGMLIAFRFLAGCAGAAPLTIGGGTIADLMVPERRGAAMAIFSLGPLLGPIIGPVAGGYISDGLGWKWIFYLLAIMAGAITILSFFLLKETYAPVLLEQKAQRLRKETGDQSYKSKYASDESAAMLFKTAIVRPIKMLFLSPIVSLLSLHMAIVYGIIYFLFTTFTFVFEKIYGFSAGSAGLVFIGMGVGCLLGVAMLGTMSDRLFVKYTKANNNVSKPEYRLPPMVYTSLFIPVGLFWYGWSVHARTPWIVPIIGTSFVGVGMIAVMMPIQSYLVDAYTRYAASAIAAITILRSLFGAVLPLAGQSMYDALGYGWGNSLLGFLALAMAPVPWIFWKYGERIRLRSELKLD